MTDGKIRDTALETYLRYFSASQVKPQLSGAAKRLVVMKDKTHHTQEIQRLLNDADFPRRTAAAVLARLSQDASQTSGYWAAAVAVLAAGLLWFGVGEKNDTQESYAGLSESSASSILQETQSAWKDTDNIINASLVSH